jgi:hypothetical protein
MLVAVPQEGAFRESEDNPPERLVEQFAEHDARRDAGLRHPSSFSPELLALIGSETAEKILEVAVAVVAPEETDIVPAQETSVFERQLVLRRREVCVGAGHSGVLRGFAQQQGEGRADGLCVCILACQEPRPGHRREWYGGELFRVVGQPGARIGLRPAPVEDELAPGMSLVVARHGAGDASRAVAQHEVARHPAGIAADATVALQCIEEGVRKERIPAGFEITPFRGRQVRDPTDDLRASAHGVRNVQSVQRSASSCSRYLSASSAAMQPVPAEVTACL